MKKFKTLVFVKSSLITLYLALTIPIPIYSRSDLKLFALVAFLSGLFLIIDITNDFVLTCDKKVSYKASFFSNILGKKNWEILWKDIKLIKSFPTSQGSKVHYFISDKDESFLVPQRIDNLKEFIILISKNTDLNVNQLSYISPLWTYKLLTFLSVLMIVGEIVAFLS